MNIWYLLLAYLSRLTRFQDKCKADRDACLKAAGDEFKKRLECYMQYRKCRPRPSRHPLPTFRPRPTLPAYIVSISTFLAISVGTIWSQMFYMTFFCNSPGPNSSKCATGIPISVCTPISYSKMIERPRIDIIVLSLFKDIVVITLISVSANTGRPSWVFF